MLPSMLLSLFALALGTSAAAISTFSPLPRPLPDKVASLQHHTTAQPETHDAFEDIVWREQQPAAVAGTTTDPRGDTIVVSPSSPTPPPTGTFYVTSHITITGFTSPHATLPGKTIELVLPTCVQTIAPDPADGYLPPGTCGALYKYRPSLAAALAAAIVFGLITAAQAWMVFVRYKKGWCWVLVAACAWEFAGFAFRAASARAQNVMGLYLVSQIFVLLAPLWINAFAYIVLGRLIHVYRPASHSLLGIPAYVFSAAFVALDVVAFIVQLVGGTMASPGAPAEEQAQAIHIYMGGIGLQQFFILIFVGLAVRFQVEVARDERRGVLPVVGASGKAGAAGFLSSWRGLLAALYFALAMVTVRIVYRLVEMSSGSPVNPLTTTETYLYVLEALPMALALLAFVVVHPARGALGGTEVDEMPNLFGVVWDKVKCGGKGGSQRTQDGGKGGAGIGLADSGSGSGEMMSLKRRGTYEKIGEVGNANV
ncbi:RTA1 domain-containing protein [Microdochium nivale]|nr:RTA1 domain-containing protein [Microdochium nivale]